MEKEGNEKGRSKKSDRKPTGTVPVVNKDIIATTRKCLEVMELQDCVGKSYGTESSKNQSVLFDFPKKNCFHIESCLSCNVQKNRDNSYDM